MTNYLYYNAKSTKSLYKQVLLHSSICPMETSCALRVTVSWSSLSSLTIQCESREHINLLLVKTKKEDRGQLHSVIAFELHFNKGQSAYMYKIENSSVIQWFPIGKQFYPSWLPTSMHDDITSLSPTLRVSSHMTSGDRPVGNHCVTLLFLFFTQHN